MMRLTELLLPTIAAGCCLLLPAAATLSPELVDLAGRIDYGFYNDEPRVVQAAHEALERLGDRPEVVYYRDLAGLRLAQLGVRERSAATALDDCAERALPNDAQGDLAAESWILIAACNVVGDRSGRRAEQALARARALDRDNPRISLVEGWVLQSRAARDATARDAVVAKLHQAAEGFETWSARPDGPDWGYAEALAALGEALLARGEARPARDLIERALLVAPEYRYAIELRSRIQGVR